MEEFNRGLGEGHALKQLSKFVLHGIVIKFSGMILFKEGRYIIANILFVKVSMIQKFMVL